MLRVRPFRGWRYSAKAGDISQIMAPPYDVIDEKFRDKLFQRSPHNIARITRRSLHPHEPLAEIYAAANSDWTKWRQQGLLERDVKACFYLYEQEFSFRGQNYTRLGLVCAHQLVEFGQGVLAHEKTLSGPKADRLELLKQTETHFGQIFGLYRDDQGAVNRELVAISRVATTLYQARDDDGGLHRLKRVDAAADIKKITELFRDKEVVIADGHHRYETALNYSKGHAKPEAAYLMMTMVSFADPGLLILPTHRLLRDVEGFSATGLLEKLATQFSIEKMSDRDLWNKKMRAAFSQEKPALGFYAQGLGLHLLTLKPGVQVAGAESQDFRKLDVTVLHSLILEQHLGINSEKLAKQSNIDYIKDSAVAITEAMQSVDRGTHLAAFFMNETSLAQTEAVARHGERMPQKSTFFYPKVFTGLVMYAIEEGALAP